MTNTERMGEMEEWSPILVETEMDGTEIWQGWIYLFL